LVAVAGVETRVLQQTTGGGTRAATNARAKAAAAAAASQEGTSYCNRAEAAAVVAAVLGLLRADPAGPLALGPTGIGVVTPYAAQARLVTDLLAKQGPGCSGVEVSSVDGYQGREKEVMVVSAVRANPTGAVGFVADWRRLNVAITRARRGLVVVGDPVTLAAGCPHWRAYIAWHRKQGTLMEVGAWDWENEPAQITKKVVREKK
jgi:regulator of nonsense transcripts 1